jgi:hypothetical protein
MANCGRARVAGGANVATSTRSLGSGVAYLTRQYVVIARPRTKIAVPSTRSKLPCSIADHEQYAQHCPGGLPHHRTNSLTWGAASNHNALRGSVPGERHHSKMRRPKWVVPIAGATGLHLNAIPLCKPYMTLVPGIKVG